MENNNNKPNNNFFSGLLLGALIGAALVFLLGTEKGKKILKAISEEGEGKISNILDKIESSVDLEDESLEDEKIVAPKRKIAEKVEKVVVEVKPRVKRFFRGISRHN